MIQTILNTILDENRQIVSHYDDAIINQALALITAAPRIFTVGQGRSGLTMQMFAMRLMHLGHTTHVVGHATTPAIRPEDLLIACSGSGTTETTCLLAERARTIGSTIICFTAVADSRLARTANLTIHIPAVPKYSPDRKTQTIQHGGLLFEQSALLLCDALFFLLRQARQVEADALWARHANLE